MIVLEMEPVVERTITQHAQVTLAVGIAASVLLLVAAFFFWRLDRKATRIGAQLVADHHLKQLGEMSAVLGHELRNPLASLKGHAQLLIERMAPEDPNRHGVEVVEREAGRIEALTNQILDFARSGQLDIAPVRPSEVAHAAAEAVNDRRVLVEVPRDLPRWPLDAARLERVLVNLLRNAVQASAPDSPVHLRLYDEGETLRIEVRDHGTGISPEAMPLLFEPFFTTRTRGTGLGLAFAKRIAQGHGGNIEATNDPQGGAVFTVTLPRHGGSA